MSAIKKLVVLGIAFLSFNAMAAKHQIPLGWGELPPCTKVVWSNKGPFGLPAPTYKEATQRAYAYASIDAPGGGEIQGILKKAAIHATAAAGLGSILASPLAAASTFQGAFLASVGAQIPGKVNVDLSVKSKCNW